MAYGMILEAFAEGDIEALKPLLGYEMMNSFADAIRERQKAGESSISISSVLTSLVFIRPNSLRVWR